MVGTTVSHYQVIGTIGTGGMGVVYLALDERLNRKVALKFLPLAIAQDPQARARLTREAQAMSAVDHPNFASVYDIGEWNGQLFIAMPYYEGETLRQRLERAPLTIVEAVRIAEQVASGLEAAHRADIVHRDVKPGNIMLTSGGQVKILDFGLAMSVADTNQTVTRMTQPGLAVGTIAYMSPEQTTGQVVDARSDVWALGVTLYEMLTGRLPFQGATSTAVALSITSHRPTPVRTLRPEVPEFLAGLIDRALERDPNRRTITAGDMKSSLAQWLAAQSAQDIGVTRQLRSARRRWAVVAGLAIVAVALAGTWLIRQNRLARWAREDALPQIDQLAEREDYVGAFLVANEARRIIPSDPVWARIDPIVSRTVSIIVTPDGATVSYRPMGSSGPWTPLGVSPVTDAIVPNGYLEWRFEKTGYVTALDTTQLLAGRNTLLTTLHTQNETPPGMVHVTAGEEARIALIAGLDHLPPQRLKDFWIDRFEVTNREFKRFVDAGGYRDPRYWPVFADGANTLTFSQAVARFVDSTGRPGPSTWESGSFLEGQDDLPVTGVSWYEASAYLAFVGKSLPSIFHWSRVADQRMSGVVAPRSNFHGGGPIKVGTSGGANRFGAFDLAGNVKEWCWNRSNGSRRYILGGAFDEPAYLFNDPDARSPFERAANFGFRGVKYSDNDPVATTGELVSFVARDFRNEKPVSNDQFAAYRTLYNYDPVDLDSRVESTDESNADWVVQRVSFNAAYGKERVPALLYLPKRGKPPYQTVVFFPGSGTLTTRSSAQINTRGFDWVVKSGRAFIHPIYKSTFERGDEVVSDYPNLSNVYREHVIAWAKDVRRTVDYLHTRSDVDHEKLGYLGFSWGSAMAPIYLSVETRFKAAVLIVGGFYVQPSSPEVESINFAPRVHVPLLMLNGRFDFFLPEDTTQIPMFRLFGTPDANKRRVAYNTGHNIPRPDLIRESLDWLDRYLGPSQ
jgi:eukaryotic-like serine/threonine-protein kinase